jgi:hypothetical protein
VEYFIKNPPKWPKEELTSELNIFKEIYKKRPIETNIHGMMFAHMFATYFILKKINPSFVIESGVYKGQSSWLIENTLPNCKILSIDIDLSKRKYISKRVNYSNKDFKYHDFSNIPENTLVFFDDHVNHYERLQQAKFFNIKNIILEDNYPKNTGDFFTIKHSYQNSGFNHKETTLSYCKTISIFFFEIINKIFKKNYYFSSDKINSRLRDHQPNVNDFKNIEKNIDTYYEFPPIVKKSEIATKPIFDDIDVNFEVSKSELSSYNHITYIKLK